jgi:hypothetical protein
MMRQNCAGWAMRVLGWVLLVVIVVGFAGRALWVAVDSTPPPAQQVRVSAPPPPTWQGRVDDTWKRHHHQFRSVSDYSQRMRSDRLVAIVGFLTFVFMTLPMNARGAKGFYRQMMATSPLPVETGASDENNRRARRLLFFYLLFLLYQIVQFPLTWGRDNDVQFISDLAIQTVLLIAVTASYTVLKRGLHEEWADPGQRKLVLAGRIEGINLRWRDIRRMAVGIWIAGFTPALLSKVTDWGDAFATFNQRVMGS